MVTTAAEKSLPLGWKYPNASPFAGRIVANVPVAPVDLLLVPEAALEPAPVKLPRRLAWLRGGEVRHGYSVLGRRVDPHATAERAPRVAPRVRVLRPSL